MRGLRRIVLVLGAVLLGGAAVAGSASSASLPRILTQRPGHLFQVRPAVIEYTGDGTGIIGGPDGTSSTNLGRLRWPTYTSTRAIGTGKVWINDCTPSCARGKFHGVAVRVRAFSPSNGRFRRLTLTYTYRGKRYIDRRVLRHVSSFWAWDIA